MNFLINLFKKAKKGDSFRVVPTPAKYNDSIAQLNSEGSNQYNRLTTETINKISKTNAELTPTTGKTGTITGS
jgi:hypothetical protein